MVKGTIITGATDPPHVFEVISVDDTERSLPTLLELIGDSRNKNLREFVDQRGQSGIVIRVMEVYRDVESPAPGFMVEISSFEEV